MSIKMSIQETLENHKLWLDGRGGERADLSRADLSEADLSEADLSWANLRGATIPISQTIYGYYELAYRANTDSITFIAGCHPFTIEEAKDHWLKSTYPDPARGRRMYEMCELYYRWWQEGVLLGVKTGEQS